MRQKQGVCLVVKKDLAREVQGGDSRGWDLVYGFGLGGDS